MEDHTRYLNPGESVVIEQPPAKITVVARKEPVPHHGKKLPGEGFRHGKKPIKNWTNGGLERALRNQVSFIEWRPGVNQDEHVSIPKRMFDEVRRRLLGRHIPANPCVRIHTITGDSEYPEFHGGKDDQCFDPNSTYCAETTAQGLNSWMLTLKFRDEHIARLKRELERDITLLDNRDSANFGLLRDIKILKGELARRLETHEVRQKLEELLHRERGVSADRLRVIKDRNATIEAQQSLSQIQCDKVEELEGVIDRQDDIIREDRAKCLADRNEAVKATLREVYRRLVKGDWS